MKVSIDTRTLKSGDIFIPIKGPNFDGHDFIDMAKEKGASEILDVDITEYARDYRKQLDIPIIAITGSSGKTTTKDLLHSVLSQKYNVHKTAENNNNEIGVPLTLLRIEGEHEIAIIEMGMRALGEIEHLASIALPTHCIVSNIGYTHLELLKSLDNIATAKSEIFTTFNDSPANRKAYFPDNIRLFDKVAGTAQNNNFEIFTSHSSDITDSNIELVTLIARDFGLKDAEIAKGIAEYKPSSNRQEIERLSDITLINDAYNANPDSMEFSVELLSKHDGRKIAVLGDMLELGIEEISLHKKLGDYIDTKNIAAVFTFGKLAKHIKPENIETFHFDNKKYLTKSLQDFLQPNDVILFKASRGLKLEEVFKSVKESLY